MRTKRIYWHFDFSCECVRERKGGVLYFTCYWFCGSPLVKVSFLLTLCVCVCVFWLSSWKIKKGQQALRTHTHATLPTLQFTGHGDWQAFTVFRHLEPALCLALSSVMDCMLNRVYAFLFLFFSLGFSPKPPPHFPLFSFFLSLFSNTGGCRLDWFLVDRWWMCVRSGNGPVSYTILFVCVCATLTTECGLKVKLYFNTALTLWVKILQVCYTVKKTCHEVLV